MRHDRRFCCHFLGVPKGYERLSDYCEHIATTKAEQRQWKSKIRGVRVLVAVPKSKLLLVISVTVRYAIQTDRGGNESKIEKKQKWDSTVEHYS